MISIKFFQLLKYDFKKVEVESIDDLEAALKQNPAEAIIYNFHPSVMPWLFKKIIKGVVVSKIAHIKIVQLGIIHEITEQLANKARFRKKKIFGKSYPSVLNSFFDFYIAPDPTLMSGNPIVYKTGRLIPQLTNRLIRANNLKPIIGSFGFATPNKGFEDLVKHVQEEFNYAHIRINMPFAQFGDADGNNARRIASACKALITKKNVSIEITHDFMDKAKLLDFLAGNTINAFFYQDKTGRGISSAVDNALAVKKPLAVTDCPMFRHILNTKPSVCVEKLSLKEIMQNGFSPLEKLADEWNEKNLLYRYEQILDEVLQIPCSSSSHSSAFLRRFLSRKQMSS